MLSEKLTCNFIKELVKKAREWEIKSITASGYSPSTGMGTSFQDIDYSMYDICVTNPPFRLYSKFMSSILNKIDFICLAPFLNRVTPNIGLPLMLKQCYLGHGVRLAVSFYSPFSKDKSKATKVCCDWLTSFPEAQDERDKALKNKMTNVNYEEYKDDYIVMENMTMKDGTHPIRVPSGQVPDDYDGWMFAPINFIDQYSTEEYEWYGTSFMKYYNIDHPENNPFAHKAANEMIEVGGKRKFHGVVFRRRSKT